MYRKRKQRFVQISTERLFDPAAVAWGDPRYTVCGRCATCEIEVQEHRDPLLAAGLRLSQGARLAVGGIRTIDDRAAAIENPPGMADSTFTALRMQAKLQLQTVSTLPRRPSCTTRLRWPCCPSRTPAISSSTSRGTRSMPKEMQPRET
ncbi:MAG: hypothetical protein LH475_01410 [Cryobacterium sp.]|uniref:hypothetical protein n=1 Tax=unclassified Cryobacterium TaxID=2649013 RepID=UPI0018CB75E8|nr:MULTISPECIES: hypothetical protein [unclassified Cryobacterium]MCY7403287.1 hypothetical protein [Cryobacterium sp.]